MTWLLLAFTAGAAAVGFGLYGIVRYRLGLAGQRLVYMHDLLNSVLREHQGCRCRLDRERQQVRELADDVWAEDLDPAEGAEEILRRSARGERW